jgi:hypothetical protein
VSPVKVARILVVVMSVGCATKNATTDVAVAQDPMGRFLFTAEIASGQRLTGVIDLAPDTVIIRPTGIECKVAARQPSGDLLEHDCVVPGTNGVQLVIDRRSPLRRSMWVQSTQVQKKRAVCTQYRTWENGTRTCELSQPEEYFEVVKKQGPLVFHR